MDTDGSSAQPHYGLDASAERLNLRLKFVQWLQRLRRAWRAVNVEPKAMVFSLLAPMLSLVKARKCADNWCFLHGVQQTEVLCTGSPLRLCWPAAVSRYLAWAFQRDHFRAVSRRLSLE
jgi:hypothetical protein